MALIDIQNMDCEKNDFWLGDEYWINNRWFFVPLAENEVLAFDTNEIEGACYEDVDGVFFEYEHDATWATLMVKQREPRV